MSIGSAFAELVESLLGQAQELAFGHRPDVGRTRLAVEKRLLANHAAGAYLRQRTDAYAIDIRDADLERAGRYEIERAVRDPALNHDFTRFERARSRYGQQLAPLALAPLAEQKVIAGIAFVASAAAENLDVAVHSILYYGRTASVHYKAAPRKNC